MSAFLAFAAWLLAVSLLGLGNTVGYHRLLTHRSFKAGHGLRGAITVLGALHSGSPMMWVGLHRLHHAKSDGDEDPHTPLKGFWFAHSGWLLGTDKVVPSVLFALSGFGQQAVVLSHDLRRMAGTNPPKWRELCPDLLQERLMRWLDVPLVMPSLFLLQLGLAWAVGGAWGLLWLWSVHLFLTNASWSVNSICHWRSFGHQTHDTKDWSRNVPWMTWVTNGEAFHNNHHRYPRSAWHALGEGRDFSWDLIRSLERLGLVSDVWLPKAHRPAVEVAAAEAASS